MKNKKWLFIILGVILLLVLIVLIIPKRKNDTKNPTEKNEVKTLVEFAQNNAKEKREYKKFIGGEVLNEGTTFTKYAFISNNKAYTFFSSKLNSSELSYKEVYTIPENIKVLTIMPNYSQDIEFLTSNDEFYEIYDTTYNMSTDVTSRLDKATYDIRKLYNESYTQVHQKQKIDYDLISTYFYSKDNILYMYGDSFDYKINKIEGNYEGEKVLKIYNNRIIKTDKGFYEFYVYFDSTLNRYVGYTMRIKSLTKYYDEVLTFTYQYVVLKDYTLIPMDDIMESRKLKYQDNSFFARSDTMCDVCEE